MSGAVIGFQIAIIVTILIANHFSEEARKTVIGLWVIETFIFVWFLSPLMFIQLGTIAIMYAVTDEICRGVIIDISISIFKFFAIIALIVLVGYFLYDEFVNKGATNQTLTQQEVCSADGNLWEHNVKLSKWECVQLYSLKIVSNPSNARIQIMNIKPKYYDEIRLKKGRYTIRVSRNGYYTSNFYIDFFGNSTYQSNLNKK